MDSQTTPYLLHDRRPGCLLFLSFHFLTWTAILMCTTSPTTKVPRTSMPPSPLCYRGDDPKPLPDPNIAHHLWKMASALQHHYGNEVAGFAVMLHGVLTGYRNTIH